MPYLFQDSIVPPIGSMRPLLNQRDMIGGFQVVDSLTDLAKMKTGAVKVGMLVSVNKEGGALYECWGLNVVYDDDYNEIVVPQFRPFYTPTNLPDGELDAESVRYERPKKRINFSYIAEGSVINVPIDMGCKSFIITNLKVAEGRLILFKIFSTLARKDLTPYTFNSSRKNYDSGMTTLYGGQNFQYRKFFTCVNQETAKANQTKFIFQCTSLEKGAYSTSKGLSWKEVEVELSYIPLEA